MSETCPNCGDDRRTTYVGDGNLICGVCLLPVALWDEWREMRKRIFDLEASLANIWDTL